MRRFALALALAGLALVAGCGPAPEPPPPGVTPPVTPGPAADVADPVTLSIPAIEVSGAPLIATGRDERGGWEVPQTAEEASWFRPGPEPGEAGTAVLLGHVDLDGRAGVFSRLHRLAPGDQVVVADGDGQRRTFEVTQVRRHPKAEFSVPDVLGHADAPELRLITCGGALERGPTGGRYADNIVVSAVLADGPTT